MKILFCTPCFLDSFAPGLKRTMLLAEGITAETTHETIVYGFGSLTDAQALQAKYKNTIVRHFSRQKYTKRSYCNAQRIVKSAANFYQSELNHIINEDQIDIIIVYSVSFALYEPIISIAKSRGVKIISDAGEFFDFSIKRLLNGVLFNQWLFYKRQIPLVDGAIFPAAKWGRRLSDLGIPSIFIPGVIDASEFDAEPSAEKKRSDAVNLVIMGALTERECIPLILKAVEKISEIEGNFRVHFFGFDLRDKVSRANYNRFKKINESFNNIHCYGKVNEETKKVLLDQADFFMLLRDDTDENNFIFPFRLGEYMSHAKPIIVSSIESFTSIIPEDCVLFTDNSEKDIVGCISTLLNRKEYARGIGVRGKIWAHTHLNYKTLASRLDSFLSYLLCNETS